MPLHRHIDHVIELRIGGRRADHHGLEDFIEEFLRLGLNLLLLKRGEFALRRGIRERPDFAWHGSEGEGWVVESLLESFEILVNSVGGIGQGIYI